MSKREFVVVARIVRPQGRLGEVTAEILTDFPEKFVERRQLWLSAEDSSDLHEYTLEDHWFHKRRIVLKFAGIDSISDAETLSGKLVHIPAHSRAVLEKDSFYVSDLIGSKLVDFSATVPRMVGVIEDVQQNVGAAPILLARDKDQEYEVPFAQEYIVRFDVPNKVLEMKLPQGLLDVNAPLSGKDKRER